MNVLDAIYSRHSYRGAYKPAPVPREDLTKIMQAGLDAPSACNRQTTSLIAVDDPSLLKRLLHVRKPPIGEYAAAIENMLLAIVELGYQSCWYEGYLTNEERIGEQMAQILGVPDDYELVCFLPVGIAEEQPAVPRKKAFGERAWFNGFQSEN